MLIKKISILPQNNSFLKGINTTPINETVIANAMQIKLSESMNINMVDFINIYAAKFKAKTIFFWMHTLFYTCWILGNSLGKHKYKVWLLKN